MSDAYLSGMGASLWLGTLLAVAIALAFRALPAIAPAWRYRAWFAVLLLCAAIPFLSLIPRRPNVIVRRATVALPTAAPTAQRASPGQIPRSTGAVEEGANEATPLSPRQPSLSLSMGPTAIPLVTAIMIGGALIGLVLLTGQLLRLYRLKRRALPLRGAIALEGDIPSAGTRRPQLLCSDELRQPAACGYFRPAILVPSSLLPQLDPDQLRHLLLHEAAHLRRWDDWALLVERLLLLLCWWHPAAWLVRRQLDTSRELACDALAAERVDRKAYARTLLSLAEWTLPAPQEMAPGALQGVLSQRIRALMGRPANPNLTVQAFTGTLAIGVASLGLVVRSPVVRSHRIVSDTVAAVHAHTGFARGAAALRLDSTLASFERDGFSGSVLVAQGDAILLDKGYGLANLAANTALLRSTRFSAAGMTKMFTAAAILVLQDEGTLSVQDSLHRWFPELPAAMGNVTLHQLLLHADGLTRLAAPVYRSDADDFVHAVAAGPASFTPGTGYRYNDFGHSILGVIIERETGRRYEDYIRERFLAPAGMTHSSFEMDGDEAAVEYSGAADRLQPIAPRAYTWGRRASLGLVTTTGDLFRWSRALHDPRVIPANVLRQMQLTFGRTDWNGVAGYGWDRMPGSGLWRRVAGTPGMEGELLYNPETDWTAVILVNTRLGWRFKVWGALRDTD